MIYSRDFKETLISLVTIADKAHSAALDEEPPRAIRALLARLKVRLEDLQQQLREMP
jgi:hypothetical protein